MCLLYCSSSSCTLDIFHSDFLKRTGETKRETFIDLVNKTIFPRWMIFLISIRRIRCFCDHFIK